MRITLNKKRFEEHIEIISRGLQSYSPLPSLKGILITATESNIQLIASDGNLSIKEVIEKGNGVEIQEPGKILVPGGIFKNVIKKQNEIIELTSDDKILEIKSQNAKTTLQLLDETEYPVISFESIGKELIIDGSTLGKIIRNVSFAAADKDRRIILNGVNLKSQNGYLTATATNSFRLAQEKVEIDSNAEFDITILSKNLKDFMPRGVRGSLSIKIDDVKILTNHKSSTISSKMIDGIYPNVSGLIPSQFKTNIKIKASEMNSLLDKASVVTNESNKVVQITTNQNQLIIESKRREVGDTIIKTENFSKEGEEVKIALNHHFFKEGVSKFDGEITISFNGSHDPIVIKGEKNPNLTQLILPHRTY